MADSQTYSDPAANARDAADSIMQDLDAMSQGSAEAATQASEAAEQQSDAEFMREFGWDERGSDFAQEVADDSTSVESAEVTAASSGSGQPSPAPAPQLDASQQIMLGMFQQMQANQQAQEARFAQMIEALRPKEAAPPPEDPFADLPDEYNTPEIKKFADYMRNKVLSPLEQYKQQMEQRIAQASHQRTVQQYQHEALSAGQSWTQKYGAQGQDATELSDWIRDQTLILAEAHGGSPAQYAPSIERMIDKAVALKQSQLNSKAKAAVGARRPNAPATPRPQANGSTIPSFQNRIPTDAEARAAGYKSAFDSALDGDAKVHKMWARQAPR